MIKNKKRLSSYLAIKGAYIETTYKAFADWDLSRTPAQNLQMIKETNNVGAPSHGWLEQFIQVTKSRYELDGADKPLIQLVQLGYHLDDWSPIQLWHITRSDELLKAFLGDWLFTQHQAGKVLINSSPSNRTLKVHRPREIENSQRTSKHGITLLPKTTLFHTTKQ